MVNDSLPTGNGFKLPPGTGRLTLLAVGVGLATLACLLYPFDFARPATGPWLAVRSIDAFEIYGHLALFVPIGICEGWLVQRVFRRRSVTVLLVSFDAAVLSLIAETLQLWLPGHPSLLVHLAANTAGGLLGVLLSDWIPAPWIDAVPNATA